MNARHELSQLEVYSTTVAPVLERLEIEEIAETEKPIPCAAMCYQVAGKWSILLRRDLPQSVKVFALAHELGHICLGLVDQLGMHRHSREVEARVNLWALELLKEYFTSDSFEKIRTLLPINEDQASKLIAANLNMKKGE